MASLTSSSDEKSSKLSQIDDSKSCPPTAPQDEKKNGEGEGGYECEFVEPPPKHIQSDCSVCLQILRDPHIVSCCGHNFCETCISRIQKNRKPCPLCNEPGFTIMANKGLKRTLNEFQVHCPHHELGCEWVGELRQLNKHLNTNPSPECQLEGCQFTSIKCIHCKDHMRRHVIEDHQNELCPKKPYTCEYCEEYESTFEDVANHWAECKIHLLPCPNSCEQSESGIERQNLKHHVKKECPLTVVECDFHYAGCGMKLPRKDMAVHMKEESVAHISLLAAENQRLVKQLLERDEKMQQLQESVYQLIQQNSELSNRIERDQQELQKELAQTKQTSQQDPLAQKTDQQQTALAIQEVQEELTQVRDIQQNAQRKLTTTIDVVKKHVQTMRQQQLAHHKLASRVAVQMQGLPRMKKLRQEPLIAPVNIKMTRYQQLKDMNTEWYSFPFYTHMCGYKMCLRVDANGHGGGKGTHVSVFTCLMRGEFDSDLKWPFRGDITIQLQNQLEDKEHYTQIIHYTDTTPASSASHVTAGEKALA